MRKIDLNILTEKIEKALIHINTNLSNKMLNSLLTARNNETEGLSKKILDELIENAHIAKQDNIPLCQDTGIVVCFVEIGNDIVIDGSLETAINDGVKKAYTKGFLRKSVVGHPLNRVNTLDNTPAIIHINQTIGDIFKITLMAKGAGSENMSRLKMMTPAEGIKGIKEFVIETVKLAGGKACPPIIVGVGIGGNFETAPLLAKKALLREIDDVNSNATEAKLEQELFDELNQLEIGPLGFGGKTTCLAVKVNTYPCHIASLPVAVNIQCHSNRHFVIEM